MEQALQDRLTVRMFEIERDTPLVAIDGHELAAHAAVSKRSGGSPSIAAQTFDFDDVCAPVPKCLACVWTEENGG